ncbi:MAG: sigma54 specific transcriptional regulator with sensor, Fis family [Firmicutes bacterium]|nr:sigma54 specific transcriptional regulator with sensor, Fis family [Bacillota bacterium]
MVVFAEKHSDNNEKIQQRIIILKKVWEDFVATGKLASNNIISAEVSSSWTRSKKRGIDPYNVPNERLSQEKLQERLKKNSQLIKVATPFLQTIAENVEGTGFRVDLFDADMYLLWNCGDTKVLEDSKTRSFIEPGICRSEATCGTNAVNLAALLEKPVQLLGPEHYNIALQHWTCSAVPIKDEKGKVIAVINAAGYYWLIHKHTLGMMTALGKSIEYCLMQQAARRELEQTNTFYKEIMESITDALIVVNSDGRIMMTNTVAKKHFGMGNFDIYGLGVDSLWGKPNPFSEVLNTGQPILDREISFVRQGKITRLMGSIRPIELKENGLKGVVGIFRGRSHTRGIIKNFVGWKAHFSFEHLIGESEAFRQVIRLARETAKMDSNVLIEGESGTGKELFAQAIHNDSDHSEGPFVVVNCAAIPNGLLESELFGYEGGAFTGAKKEGQPGKFELAEGGSIFLDEINSLPIEMQAKILRTLQNKTVVRLGGTEEIPVKVRVISASNADLWEMVQRGEFREDLFYRINVITINLPPLRERENDLELLVSNILSIKKIPGDIFDESAIRVMKNYDWPGNIRELENVLERSFVLSRSRGSEKVEAEDVLNYPGIKREVKKNVPTIDSDASLGLKGNEKSIILKALEASNGNVSAAAQMLGIARNTLYRKMKRFGIHDK